MPTKSRREDAIIERFLSAYENHSWADAEIDWLDKRIDGAVEVRAIRRSDSNTLAIEHTIVEPFVGEKEDFAFFSAAFLSIEDDKSVLVQGRWISIFVPVGTLSHQPKASKRQAIVRSVHTWIRTNRLSLCDGDSEHCCTIPVIGNSPTFDITLHIKVIPLPGPGKLHVRRQQIENNLGDVVEKALRNKLGKLMKTIAEKRILLVERQHMNLYPKMMLAEIEKRKAMFPELSSVDEIWIVETIFYETDSHLRFEYYENGIVVKSLDFLGAQLLGEL